MKWCLVALTLELMACGEGSAALPSPTALRCKLPAMSAIDMASGDNPAGGGFVQIPGGLFTPDPRAASAGLGRPIYDPAIHVLHELVVRRHQGRLRSEATAEARFSLLSSASEGRRT